MAKGKREPRRDSSRVHKKQRHLGANTTRDRGTRVAATRDRGPVATFTTAPPRPAPYRTRAMSAMVPKAPSSPELAVGPLRGNDEAREAARRRDGDDGDGDHGERGWELQRISWARAIGVFWVYTAWVILDLVAL